MMAELGTGKSVVVLAIVVGCFSILWPKIFYPMMQTALSLTSPKYNAEEDGCQFLLDADSTGYAFFANLCDQLTSRETSVHPSLRGRMIGHLQEGVEPGRPVDLMARCQRALNAVCQVDLEPALKATTELEVKTLERDRRQKLNFCLLELVKVKRKRRRFQKKRIAYSWADARQQPHLHLPPRMREAMGEARPDMPTFHQGSPHRAAGGPPHIMRDGRPFPHPSSRQPPKPQPKTGGAMSIVMPIYTIAIVGFFLYTLLKLLFKKNEGEQPDQQPIIPDYHMDPNYHRYILGDDKFSSKKSSKPSGPAPAASKTFVNESKTKRYLEEFGKQKVDSLEDEKELEIMQLKRKLQETEDALQQVLDKVSENMNRVLAATTPATTANDIPVIESLKTLIEQMQDYEVTCDEEGEQEEKDVESMEREGSKVEELQVPTVQDSQEPLTEENNQEQSSGSSPDTESYELISCPQEEMVKCDSSEANNLRQRFIAHENHAITDDSDTRHRSYKLSDILQF